MKELALVLFGELQLVILIPTIILLVSGVVSFGLFISVFNADLESNLLD